MELAANSSRHTRHVLHGGDWRLSSREGSECPNGMFASWGMSGVIVESEALCGCKVSADGGAIWSSKDSSERQVPISISNSADSDCGMSMDIWSGLGNGSACTCEIKITKWAIVHMEDVKGIFMGNEGRSVRRGIGGLRFSVLTSGSTFFLHFTYL